MKDNGGKLTKIGFITDTDILTKKERDNNTKLCNEEKYLENMDNNLEKCTRR